MIRARAPASKILDAGPGEAVAWTSRAVALKFELQIPDESPIRWAAWENPRPLVLVLDQFDLVFEVERPCERAPIDGRAATAAATFGDL